MAIRKAAPAVAAGWIAALKPAEETPLTTIRQPEPSLMTTTWNRTCQWPTSGWPKAAWFVINDTEERLDEDAQYCERVA